MSGRTLFLLWIIVAAGLLLSSCAFNLFADFELQNLLSSGTVSQKLEAAKNALSGKNFNKAIALAGSVLNEELDLDLTNDQLIKLLDSTSTLYDFAQALYDKKDELTEEAVQAVKILLEAAAGASGKGLSDLLSDLETVAEELGWDMSEIMPKSRNIDSEENFWATLETAGGTIVSLLSSFMDNSQVLKLLASGYYVLTFATPTVDSSPMYAAFCMWYDLGYMLNLIFDTNNDGKITDETLIKNTITKPASFTEYASDTISGLYHDETACDEFVWAYGIMQDVTSLLNMTIPDAPATSDLYDAQYLPDLFELLGGGSQ
ncbi:MAG TPA: hypothetical protein PLK95_07890 [Pseudothermotoga sp.]|nr:hypothetical protein [Pseudothermotoga sp.]